MAAGLYKEQCRLWRTPQFFNIELGQYKLSHHNFPRHFHNYYVIELVVSGLDRFYCQGQNHTATSGQLVLINPGEVHTGSTVDDTVLEYYSLYPDAAARLPAYSFQGRYLITATGCSRMPQSVSPDPGL
jgi:AraC-like protein